MGKETWEEKKQRKTEEKLQIQRKKSKKKIIDIATTLVVIFGIIGLAWWYISSLPETDPTDIISRSGIHIHGNISINIDGEEREITENIGIGVRNNKVHTHDTTGQLHFEKQGLVKKEDIQLKKFFDIWGEDFSKSCILDVCAEEGEAVQLLVNGEENNEYENYVVQDRDIIQINYPAKEIAQTITETDAVKDTASTTLEADLRLE